MKKFAILSFVCLLSVLVFGCERNPGVQAAYEQGNTGTYQPRPAPPPKGEVQRNDEINGELQRVNMAAKTFSIRVDNGMEQTFKFDNDTTVMGLQGKASIRDLIGKEGSEVTVQWRDQDGAKVASRVDVTQISSSRSTRRTSKKAK